MFYNAIESEIISRLESIANAANLKSNLAAFIPGEFAITSVSHDTSLDCYHILGADINIDTDTDISITISSKGASVLKYPIFSIIIDTDTDSDLYKLGLDTIDIIDIPEALQSLLPDTISDYIDYITAGILGIINWGTELTLALESAQEALTLINNAPEVSIPIDSNFSGDTIFIVPGIDIAIANYYGSSTYNLIAPDGTNYDIRTVYSETKSQSIQESIAADIAADLLIEYCADSI